MIVNRSQSLTNYRYNFKATKTPLNTRKDNPKASKSFRTIIPDKEKIVMMNDMNKKFQLQLINTQITKMKEASRYSPKRAKKISLEKYPQNPSPRRLKRLSNSKQKPTQKSHNISSTKDLLTGNQNFTLLGQKFIQKRMIQNQDSLIQIQEDQICISKTVQDSWLKDPNGTKIGYWIPSNKYVSLFPINSRKIDKVYVINQPLVLPLLGSLTIKSNRKNQKYIVTELYDKNTLRDLAHQFGSLEESIVKNYLRQILLCLHNLHKNKIYHNRLSAQSIIYTQTGGILINMLKSSVKPLTQTQKYSSAHQFPPQMLLSKTCTNSQKNDVWSIGCIALQLLTNSQFKNNYYHPYNRQIEHSTVMINKNQQQKNFRFMTSFEPHTYSKVFMNESTCILQKVKKLLDIEVNIKQSVIFFDLCQSIQMKQLSSLAQDFINKCFNVKLSKRPSIQEIRLHPFLK